LRSAICFNLSSVWGGRDLAEPESRRSSHPLAYEKFGLPAPSAFIHPAIGF
jgi:hypothetical protein